MSTTVSTCPTCGVALEHVLTVRDVPVVTTALWPSAQAAGAAPVGDIELAICPVCALLRNTAFDAGLVEYDAAYENSQHFSPTFLRYARDLAADVAERHDLAGGTVLEVGSGKGEFLALLCQIAGCRGIGFDPSYDGEVDEASAVTIRRTPFERQPASTDVRLVCCRHVLEHIEDPVAFLCDIRGSVPAGTPVYFEVPDGTFVLGPGGLWDLIYPHVSYFSAPSIERLFRRCGFDVGLVRSVFGGQYLTVHAVAAEPADAEPDPRAVARVRRAADELARTFARTVAGWSDALRSRVDGTVLWGAGAKGVSFLNLLDDVARIGVVVDVNPRKHGFFVPHTGQEILPPVALRGRPVERVVVMNPAYRDEIHQQLNDLALDPELLCI